MSTPFIAEIRMLGCNFAPVGWAFCNGQIVPISQNTALFSLLGTNYGGNGVTSFALPDLQGRTPMHWGQGAGLTNRNIGESGGSPVVTLTTATLSAHGHAVIVPTAAEATADRGNASGNILATPVDSTYAAGGAAAVMSAGSSTPAGGGQAHNNMQPFLAVNFCIALVGVFPTRA